MSRTGSIHQQGNVSMFSVLSAPGPSPSVVSYCSSPAVCLVGDVWRVLAVGPLETWHSVSGAKQMPPHTTLQRVDRRRRRPEPHLLAKQNKFTYIFFRVSYC